MCRLFYHLRFLLNHLLFTVSTFQLLVRFPVIVRTQFFLLSFFVVSHLCKIINLLGYGFRQGQRDHWVSSSPIDLFPFWCVVCYWRHWLVIRPYMKLRSGSILLWWLQGLIPYRRIHMRRPISLCPLLEHLQLLFLLLTHLRLMYHFDQLRITNHLLNL